MRPFINSKFRFAVNGGEYLRLYPEGRPLIFAGNHRSHLDALVLMNAVLPPYGSRGYLASIAPAKTMEENPLFSFTRLLGTFPLDRSNPQLALDYFYESLRAGLGLFIFPQGGRVSRTPIQDYQSFTREGRTGVGRLVLRMNGEAPVIPFYIHGSYEALGQGRMMPRFGAYVSVTFGEPLLFDKYRHKTGWQRNDEFYSTARVITDEIMKKVQILLYNNEKPLFEFLEKRFGRPIDDISLSRRQEREVKRLTRMLASLTPSQTEAVLKKHIKRT